MPMIPHDTHLQIGSLLFEGLDQIDLIPIDSSADLIDGVNDPGIAGQGGETPDLVT